MLNSILLDKVKSSLRIKSNSCEEEILDLIESCKIDLKLSGVKKILETDALIQHAIVLYCKANFGLDNKNSEKYQLSYDLLKCSLSLSGEYNVV